MYHGVLELFSLGIRLSEPQAFFHETHRKACAYSRTSTTFKKGEEKNKIRNCLPSAYDAGAYA